MLGALRHAVLAADDAEFSSRTFDGDEIELRTLLDELATVALFGGGSRLVVVAEADGFVSKNREALEDYAAKPRRTGVLVLEVDSWPSNTRLYKHLAEHGRQIDCKEPSEDQLLKWLRDRAQRSYAAGLAPGAGERLLEIVGPQMGRLDQELAKLALLAGPTAADAKSAKPPAISIQLVEQAVGGWRAKTVWEMIDAAAAGDAREGLIQLDRLLLAGENPIGILAMIASPLRKLAAAARIIRQSQSSGQRIPMRQALEAAGVNRWPKAMDQAESQIRQLGARRAEKIYAWLLEADLALKGVSSSTDRARLVLEQLIVRMSRQIGARDVCRN